MLRNLYFLSKPLNKTNRWFVRRKSVNIQNMNKSIKKMYLMDDDPVYVRYKRLKQRLQQCPGSLPFEEILMANSGDMQSIGYEPLTYIRQVASAALYPPLLEHQSFPDDVKLKVCEILKHHKSVGSYSNSNGVEMFRIKIAEYLCRRDHGIIRNHNDLLLNGGSTEGIVNILKLLYGWKDGKRPAVLIPSPCYPYGIIEGLGFKLIPYELDEENFWASTTENMECAIEDAKDKYTPRAILIINPSNPTGTVLKQTEMEEIVKFACKEKLFLIVDESYQRNVYGKNEFKSMKKVMADMGKPYSEMEMVSVFSLAKDVVGETGIRGGLMEVQNLDEKVMKYLEKSISANLCSNVIGQIMMYAFADHPIEGDPSYDLWKKETDSRFETFACNAKIIVDELNNIEGFSCPPVEGGFFAYPKICVPEKAMKEGEKKGYDPSTFYALKLLEETGVLVTPGDVFGEEENPHIRVSILPLGEKLKTILSKINSFNNKFLIKYAD